jgi:hypothetical protein
MLRIGMVLAGFLLGGCIAGNWVTQVGPNEYIASDIEYMDVDFRLSRGPSLYRAGLTAKRYCEEKLNNLRMRIIEEWIDGEGRYATARLRFVCEETTNPDDDHVKCLVGVRHWVYRSKCD